jgi:hypothetical protein
MLNGLKGKGTVFGLRLMPVKVKETKIVEETNFLRREQT